MISPENDFSFEPMDACLPAFVKSAEEIRTRYGEEVFNKIKEIVDDQLKHRDEYFQHLIN